jgi:predicted DNA binding protein
MAVKTYRFVYAWGNTGPDMTILVEFSISAERFELGGFVDQYENLTAELERIVPADNRAIPYVWVTGPEDTLDRLAATFEESALTRAVAVVDRLAIDGSEERQHLFRIEWVLSDLDIVRGIVEAGGDILEGESTDDYWLLRFRFDSHGHVAEFYQFLADNEITDFNIERIFELTDRSERLGGPDLTPEQREALTLAAMEGYFDSPRGASLADIGDELGITQQAVSDRVRRATRRVVFDALNVPENARYE